MTDTLALRARLHSALAAACPGRALPAPGRWQALAGGRSNLCWRLPGPGADAQGALVLKLYRPDRASIVFPNDPAAELACLQALDGAGLAPEPVAAGDGTDGPWLAYRHLPGPCWSADPAPVARLLRRLHARPVPAALRDRLHAAPAGRAGLSGQVRQVARALGPADRAAILDRLAGLPAASPDPAAGACLLHGDPVPANIVMTPAGARLIDWQCPALGDPCLDLAIFLSPAMALTYLGRTLSTAEHHAVLAAYDAPGITARLAALAPLLHLRMAAHCLARAAAAGPARGADGASEAAQARSDARAAGAELAAFDRARATGHASAARGAGD